MKTGYLFVLGTTDYYDYIPVENKGVYLDHDKAFARLCEMNKAIIEKGDMIGGVPTFYEWGYGEDYYPKDNLILKQAEEAEDWVAYEAELDKHILTDIVAICKQIEETGCPYDGLYGLVEVDIIE